MTRTKLSATVSLAWIVVALTLTTCLCIVTKRLVSLSNSIAVLLPNVAAATGQQSPRRIPTDAEVARMQSLSRRIDVIADNLANAQTTAYKRRRSDLDGGLDNATVPFPTDMTEGALKSTGASLDVAIVGEGFYRIKLSPTTGDGTEYTRNGSLFRNAKGDVVVGIGSGYELIPALNIPIGATNIAIAQDGSVTYVPANGAAKATAGQLMVASFMNPQGLSMNSPGIYLETEASGPPAVQTPGANGSGSLMQGYLENSNVDPIKESVELMKAEQLLQREYQTFHLIDESRRMIAGVARE